MVRMLDKNGPIQGTQTSPKAMPMTNERGLTPKDNPINAPICAPSVTGAKSERPISP